MVMKRLQETGIKHHMANQLHPVFSQESGVLCEIQIALNLVRDDEIEK